MTKKGGYLIELLGDSDEYIYIYIYIYICTRLFIVML
jgi:hypothetical protein